MLAIKTDVISRNERTVGVSGLSLPVCNLQFRSGASNMTLSREGMTWICLLSSTDARTEENGAMSMELGGQSLDHWRGVIWDPGIVRQQSICVCYDCLCLMTLFRTMWLLVHDWAGWPVWTEIVSGYCRTITWEVGWLRSPITPCDVDRLCANMKRQIKEVQGDVVVEMTEIYYPVVRGRAWKDSDPSDWSVWMCARFGRLL